MWQRVGWGEEAYLYGGRSGKWSLGKQKALKMVAQHRGFHWMK